MKERPIIFSGPMVRALLDGRKTQTRRVVKPQCMAVYCLTDSGTQCIHIDNDLIEWSCSKADPIVAERRLYGRKRWSDLLSDQICWLWKEEVRGVVFLEGTSGEKEGILPRIVVPQQPKDNKGRPPSGVHGVSWHASESEYAGKAFGRESTKQQAGESPLGYAAGELVGQEGSRTRMQRGKTPCCQIVRPGKSIPEMGHQNRPLLSKICREDFRHVAGFDLVYSKFCIGSRLWVRETWSQPGGVLRYRADGESKDVWKWAPSLYMPRSASRITLEITGVRVERLQEISEEDAKAEGVEPIVDNSPFGHKCGWLDYCDPKSLPFDHDKPSASFRSLWQTIHGHGSWDANPWVWVIEFKRNDKLTRDAGTQKL